MIKRFSGNRFALAINPVVAVAAAALFVSTMITQPAAARSAPDSFADLAERLSPAVVNISTTQKVASGGNRFGFRFPPGSPFEDLFKDFMERNRDGQSEDDQQSAPQQPQRRVTSLGSGFVIDPAGFIVTNNHVIKDADTVSVNFSNGDRLDAKIIGKDKETDLALLKVESDAPLAAVPWGNSDQARVGDWVMAIGNPFGLGGSVTAGIISARGRDIQQGRYDDFLQTDASINQGNSGGPLFNMAGEVIGVNTAIFSPSGGSVGIGFSISSSLAQRVIAQLQKYGQTKRGWLGVRIQNVTDEIAEGLGLDDTIGALVAGVGEGGPAEKSGIRAGDVILQFDGREVSEMRLLPRMVADADIGAPVPVTLWRDGKEVTLDVILDEQSDVNQASLVTGVDEAQGPDFEADDLGLTLSAITPALRKQFQLDEAEEGVVVTGVAEASPAGEKGIQNGDIILGIANEPVSSLEDARRQVEQVKESGRKIVMLHIKHKGAPSFVALNIDKDE